jgi:hypothetical protein
MLFQMLFQEIKSLIGKIMLDFAGVFFRRVFVDSELN